MLILQVKAMIRGVVAQKYVYTVYEECVGFPGPGINPGGGVCARF
jgi:hypothetical protein